MSWLWQSGARLTKSNQVLRGVEGLYYMACGLQASDAAREWGYDSGPLGLQHIGFPFGNDVSLSRHKFG